MPLWPFVFPEFIVTSTVLILLFTRIKDLSLLSCSVAFFFLPALNSLNFHLNLFFFSVRLPHCCLSNNSEKLKEVNHTVWLSALWFIIKNKDKYSTILSLMCS